MNTVRGACTRRFDRSHSGSLVSEMPNNDHHRPTREIFRGNQFDVFTLPFFFRGDRIENFRIDSAQSIAVPRRRYRSTKSSFNARRKVAHRVRRYIAHARTTWPHELTLFYERKHAG